MPESSAIAEAVRSETANRARKIPARAVAEDGIERDCEGDGISIAAPRIMTRFCSVRVDGDLTR